MATTTGGTTYVTSTDLVADYPTASLALANRVDVVASGSMSKKTASYTVTVADILAGTTICMNSASATVITLPSTSLVNGMMVNVFSVNTGAVTFTGGTVTGTTTSITAQYSGLSLTYDSAAAVWWCLPFGGGSARAAVSGTTGSPTITTVGSKTCYKFTGTGTVTISGAGGFLDFLLVGGGGGGGSNSYGIGCGAGAGGYTYRTDFFVPAGTYTLTVGGPGASGTQGTNSLAFSLPSVGGGPGGGGGPNAPGSWGGSGGGSAWWAGGGGTTQPAGPCIPPQGNLGGLNGGTGANGAAGGGSSAAGSGTTAGAGTANSITGSSVTYAAGGGVPGGAGTVNTGNGGGVAASGGSGIAILLIG